MVDAKSNIQSDYFNKYRLIEGKLTFSTLPGATKRYLTTTIIMVLTFRTLVGAFNFKFSKIVEKLLTFGIRLGFALSRFDLNDEPKDG